MLSFAYTYRDNIIIRSKIDCHNIIIGKVYMPIVGIYNEYNDA